jgi:hypothetical protein
MKGYGQFCPKATVQAFPGWLQLSHFARVLQPTHAG